MDVDLKSLNHICVLGRYLANRWSYKAPVFDKTLEIFCPRDNMITAHSSANQFVNHSTTFQTCSFELKYTVVAQLEPQTFHPSWEHRL